MLITPNTPLNSVIKGVIRLNINHQDRLFMSKTNKKSRSTICVSKTRHKIDYLCQ